MRLVERFPSRRQRDKRWARRMVFICSLCRAAAPRTGHMATASHASVKKPARKTFWSSAAALALGLQCAGC